MEGLREFEWEGEGDEGVVGWVLGREGVREVTMRVRWEGGEGEGGEKRGRERWEEMEEALRVLRRGEGGGRRLQLVRSNAREARLRVWRRLAPHVCFAPTQEREVEEGAEWDARGALMEGMAAAAAVAVGR